jgi:lysophospholipid acyltransferase (LPLAT)-like uncharacterized protein
MSQPADHTQQSEAPAHDQPTRKRARSAMLKRLTWSRPAMMIAGFLMASHYQLVRRTTRRMRLPAVSFDEPWESEGTIIAVWHGQGFLMPFLGVRNDKMNVLTTYFRDGEIVTRACEYYGIKSIRGSGDHGKEFMRKKAVQAFMAMLRMLKRGEHVVVTADVPKIARVAGLGIVTLAKHSGRPIVPVAMATTRRIRLSNWDRTCLHLPFGRMVMLRGEPIRVARDADDDTLEAARRVVEERLNDLDARAYAIVDDRRA